MSTNRHENAAVIDEQPEKVGQVSIQIDLQAKLAEELLTLASALENQLSSILMPSDKPNAKAHQSTPDESLSTDKKHLVQTAARIENSNDNIDVVITNLRCLLDRIEL